MELYQVVMVALSESVMWNIVNQPLAEKSRWRHIRLALKPRYLGNRASKIRNCNVTLLGSRGRSSRIGHEHVSATPPGGGLTMMWYLVGIKTSLFWKHTSQLKSCWSLTLSIWSSHYCVVYKLTSLVLLSSQLQFLLLHNFQCCVKTRLC